jgi:hypothetical protein
VAGTQSLIQNLPAPPGTFHSPASTLSPAIASFFGVPLTGTAPKANVNSIGALPHNLNTPKAAFPGRLFISNLSLSSFEYKYLCNSYGISTLFMLSCAMNRRQSDSPTHRSRAFSQSGSRFQHKSSGSADILPLTPIIPALTARNAVSPIIPAHT